MGGSRLRQADPLRKQEPPNREAFLLFPAQSCRRRVLVPTLRRFWVNRAKSDMKRVTIQPTSGVICLALLRLLIIQEPMGIGR